MATVYVLMLENETPCGTTATIEAVYDRRAYADKHAAIINEGRTAGYRARVCPERIVTEDRWPALGHAAESEGV